jgi:hypothetical protein
MHAHVLFCFLIEKKPVHAQISTATRKYYTKQVATSSTKKENPKASLIARPYQYMDSGSIKK